MKSITRQELEQMEWTPVENDIPPRCNLCKGKVGHGGYALDINIDEDSSFLFVVCSEICKDRFVCHPLAISYINDSLQQVS